nr:uncharacterized protein LOC109781271 isoform X1 [Aegilops tauschii subsp. strangulata]
MQFSRTSFLTVDFPWKMDTYICLIRCCRSLSPSHGDVADNAAIHVPAIITPILMSRGAGNCYYCWNHWLFIHRWKVNIYLPVNLLREEMSRMTSKLASVKLRRSHSCSSRATRRALAGCTSGRRSSMRKSGYVRSSTHASPRIRMITKNITYINAEITVLVVICLLVSIDLLCEYTRVNLFSTT